jgi:hypothetical protein
VLLQPLLPADDRHVNLHRIRPEREGKYPVTRPDFEARSRAAHERFEAAGGKAAVVGKPVEEAEAWCKEHGFPLVLVEQIGGASNLSWAPGRVRLRVDDGGIVRDVHLG